MKFDSLEDKCQYYRSLTDYKILPNSNILVMLDGKNFSKLIKNNFDKPFDDEFVEMMNNTAKFLCNNVQGVKFAYVQSDEISLLITDYDTPETDTMFGGRLCKIQSILASLATSEFNRQFIINKLSKGALIDRNIILNTVENMKLAQFDCKCWTVPNQNDAYAWFLYRQIDCIRNSKQQAAQTYLSHKELVGKDTDKQIELLKEKEGIDWYNYPDKYRFGRFIYKVQTVCHNTVNGQDNEFIRNKFTVIPAFELAEDNGKTMFCDIAFNEIKNYEK